MKDQSTQVQAGRVGFGAWLSARRNFMLFSMLGGGGASFAIFAAVIYPARPLNFVVLGVLCLLGGYIWGWFMWKFFEAKREDWAKRIERDV